MTREKKNLTLILLLLHVLEFVIITGIMYAVYSKTSTMDEALSAADQAALMRSNAETSLMIGLASSIPGFLVWHFYILPMMMKEKA